MTYNQLVAYFGGLSKAAQALDSSRQNVHSWSVRKRIPTNWQIKIAAMTDLKADKVARRKVVELSSYIERTRRQEVA